MQLQRSILVPAISAFLMLAGCGGNQTNEPAQSPHTTSASAAVDPNAPTTTPSAANDTFVSGGSSTGVPTRGGGPENATDAPETIVKPPPVNPSMSSYGANGAPMGTGGAAMDSNAALTDAQIAQLAATANAGEIEQGRYAVQHATNPRVKKFAQHMVSAHGSIGQKMTAVLQKESIVPAASMQSTKLSADVQQTMDGFQGKTGADFDKAYMDAQVKQHQAVLDMFDNKLIPGAQDAQLKATLQQARPMVAEHLQEAQEIQKSLAATP